MSEKTGWLYQADDGQEMRVIAPRGLILPPTIEAHEPLVGAVVFRYVASTQFEKPSADV